MSAVGEGIAVKDPVRASFFLIVSLRSGLTDSSHGSRSEAYFHPADVCLHHR